MASTHDLGGPETLKLTEIFLDPNNPRTAPEPAPGYDDAAKLFDPDVQEELINRVYDVYNASTLENSIIEQGWTPVDPILVWQHPGKAGYIVVEGNTRISVLRRVRARLEKERAKLDRMSKGGGYPQQEVRKQTELVERIDKLIAATDKIQVYPVVASSVAELDSKLPRLLGVRHIFPAKNWTPYATNLYILFLYERAFRAVFKDDDLRIEQKILEAVARQLPMRPDDIRKAIQAASAFGHFKRAYDERVQEAGNSFNDGDQYYFDNILASTYARNAFGFGPTDLQLSEQSEEALFQWAFAKKRGASADDPEAENENVFQKAEDIRIWQRISRYDAKTGVTNFAKRLDVSAPEDAISVSRIETEQKQHKEKSTPIQTLDKLLKTLKELKADTLKAQGAHLRPMLDEIAEQVQGYIQMIEAAAAVESSN